MRISYSLRPGYIVFSLALLLFCNNYSCKINSQPQVAAKQIEIIDQRAREIIDQSIATHGGLDRWEKIKRFEYDKSMTLYLENGEVESQVDQSHTYQYGDEEVFRVHWKDGSDQHDLYGRRGAYSKSVNQVMDENADPEKLKNSLFSSTYVIGIPFKLLDPGPAITYVGTEQIWTGETCDVIKVGYDPAVAENLTTADTWWYYFDQNDARVRAAKVKHLDHISGLRNISYVTENGFLLNHERESYRLGEGDSVLYLRAKYLYDNYKVIDN